MQPFQRKKGVPTLEWVSTRRRFIVILTDRVDQNLSYENANIAIPFNMCNGLVEKMSANPYEWVSTHGRLIAFLD